MKQPASPQKEDAAVRRTEAALFAAMVFEGGAVSKLPPLLSDESIQKVLEILKGAAPEIDAEKQRRFLLHVCRAEWVFSVHSDQPANAKAAILRLSGLLNATKAIRAAWREVEADDQLRTCIALGAGLEDSFEEQAVADASEDRVEKLDGELGSIAAETSGARYAPEERLVALFDHDLPRLEQHLELLVSGLRKSANADVPWRRAAVWDIAQAWSEATGALPTYSNDKGSPTSSAFERLVEVVIPALTASKAHRAVTEVVRAVRVMAEQRRRERTPSGTQ